MAAIVELHKWVKRKKEDDAALADYLDGLKTGAKVIPFKKMQEA